MVCLVLTRTPLLIVKGCKIYKIMNLNSNMEIIVNAQPIVSVLDKGTVNMLKLIALQNGMLINRPAQLKRVVRILKQSIINN